MYALLKFVEDSVYYVCHFKHTKKTSNEMHKAKWIDGRYYLAKLIARHHSKVTLEQFRKNLELNYPIITLSPIETQHNFCSSLNLSTSNEFTPTVTLNASKRIEPLDFLSVERAQNECTHRDRDLDSNMQFNDVFHENFNLVPATDQNVNNNNTEEDIEDDAFSTSLFEIEIVDENFNELLLDNHAQSDILNSNKLIPVAEEVAIPVEVDFDKQENFPSIEIDFPELIDIIEEHTNSAGSPVALEVVDEDVDHERSGSSSLITLTKRKTKAIPLRYDRSVVLQPCSDTRTKDISKLPVLLFEKENVRKYFCIYCKKLFRKFPQHLQVSHRNEVAVKMYMNLPPRNAERRKIIETIRRRGDFEYNTSDECSELLVVRRSQINFPKASKDYLPCPYCTAFFCRSTLRLHVKHCSTVPRKGERNIQVLSRTILNSVHPSASEVLKNKVFSVLRNDDCVTIVRYDRLAITYGNFLCSKYSSPHHHDMIRSKLRTIGRLLIAARSLDSTVTDFASLLTPEKFDVTVAAIKQVGGINNAQTAYNAPTTVLNLSTICKQASQVWKSTCIKDSNHESKQKVEDFLILFNVTFPAELGRTAVENQVQFQRQKVVELPSTEDIIKLIVFLRKNRRFWFSEIQSHREINIRYALKQLASFTLVSIMVFNRRRPGELERITINDFRTLKSAHTVSAVAGHLRNDEERELAKRYKRFEIRGKLNRTVPVLLDFEIEECLNLIIARREEAGIPPENPYIFAYGSTDHRNRYLRAYFLLRSYANQCGAAKPNLLKATELRKQIATECALRDLSENVIHDVANFMGHNINIHNNIYRMPVDKRDIVRMSKILEMIQAAPEDEDLNGQDEDLSDEDEDLNDKDKDLNDEDTDSNDEHENLNDKDENLNDKHESLNLQNQNDDNDDISYEPPDLLNLTDAHSFSEERKHNKKKKGRHIKGLRRVCGSKKPWSAQERGAAKKHFGKYLEMNNLPSISILCEELRLIAELKERSPTSVKSWLQNELVNRKSTFSNDHNPNKKKRTRWTSAMKDRLSTVFSNHFKFGTLPSKPECIIAIENYDEFEDLTPAALKTAVANELQRKSKHEPSRATNRQLF
ncbi:hypothetical protein RN001_002631 [Aquatica leii]|uniref:Uncharacterized protein n=1 Tax=Aquatica leii TaxID=1421715 RepID=A0AAN7PDR8_9COLE|nr:hypothetical protein RN001_002631 [Aquatica leii]